MVVLHLEPASKKLPSSLTEVTGPKMTAKAILICRPNSHPFQDRTLYLDQPVKVGRSVARARPATNNAIFDCKVLSRNHALLWYENGKFYLQDTKSSNGTFVNNQRLSRGSEESAPREVCSGDIVQYGVDVMENSRKGKVTHGCIVATLKIYLPDGKEAKASPSTAVLPPLPSSGTILTQDLYQLANYLQEALHREQMLENKLTTLQNLVGNSHEASTQGWKALIDEDRLLTRLEILENQLQTYSKNFSEDKLREEVAKLQEDKNSYQMSAKESLQKILQEKLEAVKKLQDVEGSLSSAETECGHLRDMHENLQRDLQEIAEKCSGQMQEIQELNDQLQDAEEKHSEKVKALEDEKSQLEARLAEVTKEEDHLKIKIDALENDVEKEKVLLHENENESDDVTNESERIISDSLISEKDSIQDSNDEMEKLQCQLKDSERQLKECRLKIETLQEQIHHLEDELKRVQQQQQSDEEDDDDDDDDDKTSVDSVSSSSSLIVISKNEQNQQQQQQQQLQQQQVNGSPPFNQNNVVGDSQANVTNTLKVEMEKLKELLTEARDKKIQVEAELKQYKGELEEARTLADSNAKEASTLRQRIESAQSQTDNKEDVVEALRAEISKLEAVEKQELLVLKERLDEERKRAGQKEEEASALKQQLLEANQNWKRSQNEAEHLKQKLKSASDETDTKSGRTSLPHGGSVLDNKSAEDYLMLKEECANLKTMIHSIEAEMRKTRNENSKLQSDYKKLQDSYQELEALKSRIDRRQNAPIPSTAMIDTLVRGNDDNEYNEEIRNELVEAHGEVLRLKLQYNQCNDEKVKLKERLEHINEEYEMLSYQTRTIWRNIYMLLGVISAVILVIWVA